MHLQIYLSINGNTLETLSCTLCFFSLDSFPGNCSISICKADLLCFIQFLHRMPLHGCTLIDITAPY